MSLEPVMPKDDLVGLDLSQQEVDPFTMVTNLHQQLNSKLILPSLFCDPSTLYIVIGFSKGDGSRPTLFAHSKSMKQLVHPESTRAFVMAHLPVLRASKCTWMASSHGTRFSTSGCTLVGRSASLTSSFTS